MVPLCFIFKGYVMATRKNVIEEEIRDIRNEQEDYEYVNHPKHYNQGGIELVKIVDAYQLGFYEGNIVKYIIRSGKKPGNNKLQDLKKAQWYLNYLIGLLEKDSVVI